MTVEDLYELARAADPRARGLAVLEPGRAEEPGWVVVTVDGVRVRIDGVAPDSPALAALTGADVSAGAVAARTVTRESARAVVALLGTDEPTLKGMVSLLRLSFTMMNDLRERQSPPLPRVQEPDIIRMAALVFAGADPRAVLAGG